MEGHDPGPSAGYITWEQYLRNQERLRQNVSSWDAPGVPRAGAVLLGGIIECGICQHRLNVIYSKKAMAGQKIKRKGPMTLDLEPTIDILAELARHKSSQVIVGFAAETENVLENARKKLASKSLDAIVVNDVSREGVGFDSDRNAVTIIFARRSGGSA